MATTEINAAGGIRNDVAAERLAPTDLVSGTNIDIDQTGRVSRRRGVTLLDPGAGHSIWSDGKRAFYVLGTTLTQLFPDNTTRVIQTGIRGEVAYHCVASTVYWSDGYQSGEIVDGANRQWGIAVPSPVALAQTYGDMPAGTYGVTVVALRNGQESGAPRGQFITIPDSGGITVSGLPGSPYRLYMTATNGEVFFAAGDYNGFASVNVRSADVGTLPLRTQFAGPAPAGRVIGNHAGRMWIGSDNALHYSEPFEYGLFKANSFMLFESPVAIFAPVKDGVFVATATETIFFKGDDPAEMVPQPVAGFGGVRGTLVFPPSDKVTNEGVQGACAMWASPKGAVLGTSGGELLNLTGNRYVMPEAVRGAGLFKVRSGTPQYVTTLFR